MRSRIITVFALFVFGGALPSLPAQFADPFGSPDEEPRELTEEEKRQRAHQKRSQEHRGQQLAAPAGRFRTAVGHPIPNVELPPHVVAGENQLSLFADYANPAERGVPLYIVNRTGEAVNFPCEDHDIAIRMEFRDADGHWVRAQNAVASFCGNSSYAITLPPGQHFPAFGYSPGEGKVVPVRYRRVSGVPLVSNIGEGRYLEADRIAASLDHLAWLELPSPLAMLIGSPTIHDGNTDPPSDLEYVAGLHLISQYRDSAFFRRAAEFHVTSMDAGSAEAVAIREILAREWPKEGDELKLFRLCTNIASRAAIAEPVPGAAAAQRAIAWGVLGALQQYPYATLQQNPQWRPLTRKAYQLLPEGIESDDAKIVGAASKLLGVAAHADEYVPTSRLLKWLETDHPEVLTHCARALARRGHWGTLAERSMGLAPDRLPLVLTALLISPESKKYARKPSGKPEQAFWSLCVEKAPAATMRAVYPYVKMSSRRLSPTLHPGLRAYLAQQLAKVAEDSDDPAHQSTFELGMLIEVIASWRAKGDLELFEELLEHPRRDTSMMSDSAGQFTRTSYRLRKAARDHLMSMGAEIPPGIVFEVREPERPSGLDQKSEAVDDANPFQTNQ